MIECSIWQRNLFYLEGFLKELDEMGALFKSRVKWVKKQLEVAQQKHEAAQEESHGRLVAYLKSQDKLPKDYSPEKYFVDIEDGVVTLEEAVSPGGLCPCGKPHSEHKAHPLEALLSRMRIIPIEIDPKDIG